MAETNVIESESEAERDERIANEADAKFRADMAARKSTEKGSLAIIERAVALKLGADEIGKLVALHERLEDRRAEAAYSLAMNACQQEMATVVRDRANERTKKLYASLDAVNVIAKPIYTKHGFAVSFSEEKADREGYIRTAAEVMHIDGCTKRKWIEFPKDGIGPKGEPIGGMNAVQGAISSGSYGQRVLLCRIFNITIADTDVDGGNPSEPLSDEQVRELNTLYDECTDLDGKRFMSWLRERLKNPDLEGLGHIPQSQFAFVRDALAKRAKKGGAS